MLSQVFAQKQISIGTEQRALKRTSSLPVIIHKFFQRKIRRKPHVENALSCSPEKKK